MFDLILNSLMKTEVECVLSNINTKLEGKEPTTLLLLGGIAGYYLRPMMEQTLGERGGTGGLFQPAEGGQDAGFQKYMPLILGAVVLYVFFLKDDEPIVKEGE